MHGATSNDAQASATDALGVKSTATAGTYGLFVHVRNPEELAISIEDRLDIIPASRALAQIDPWLSMQARREDILKKRLAPARD